MATRYASKGVVLQRKNATTFETIPNTKSIKPPNETLEMIDVTVTNSTGGYREKAPTFKDGGEVTATMYYDPDDTIQTAVYGDYSNSTKTQYRVKTTAGAPNVHWEFDAYVTGWERGDMTPENYTEVTLKLTISGPVTKGSEA